MTLLWDPPERRGEKDAGPSMMWPNISHWGHERGGSNRRKPDVQCVSIWHHNQTACIRPLRNHWWLQQMIFDLH